jgi:hypothetical protein
MFDCVVKGVSALHDWAGRVTASARLWRADPRHLTSALVPEIRTRELEGGATRMPLGKAGVDSVLLE